MDFRLGRDFVDQKIGMFSDNKRYWPTKSQLIDSQIARCSIFGENGLIRRPHGLLLSHSLVH